MTYMGLGNGSGRPYHNIVIVHSSHVHRGRAFAGTEILHYTERLHVHTDKTVQKLKGLSGKPVECGHLLNALAFDMYVEPLCNWDQHLTFSNSILDIGFSQDTGLQQVEGDFKHVKLIHAFLMFVQVCQLRFTVFKSSGKMMLTTLLIIGRRTPPTCFANSALSASKFRQRTVQPARSGITHKEAGTEIPMRRYLCTLDESRPRYWHTDVEQRY